MAIGRPRAFDYDKALDKAMLVFWEKGYEGTAMPDLTAAMGMNRPSIYAAFGNKEQLFCKAIARYRANTEAYLGLPLKKHDLHDAIHGFLHNAAKAFTCGKSPAGCMAVQGALACSDGATPAKNESSTCREAIVRLLKTRFEQAAAEGVLPGPASPEALARFYAAVLHGMSVQSAGGASFEQLVQVADTALLALPH